MKLNSFSCAYWPLIYLLLWSACVPLPLKIGLSPCYWISGVLYIFWIQLLCFMNIFSQSVTCFLILLIMFYDEEFLCIWWSLIYHFWFYDHTFCLTRNVFLPQGHKYILLCFLFCFVLGFTFRSVICLK